MSSVGGCRQCFAGFHGTSSSESGVPLKFFGPKTIRCARFLFFSLFDATARKPSSRDWRSLQEYRCRHCSLASQCQLSSYKCVGWSYHGVYYAYFVSFSSVFHNVSLRTRTVRTKEVHRGRPSGHSRRALGGIRAVHRACGARSKFVLGGSG